MKTQLVKINRIIFYFYISIRVYMERICICNNLELEANLRGLIRRVRGLIRRVRGLTWIVGE